MLLPLNVEYVRTSKNLGYENPYTVTGGVQRTGLKRKPKGRCTDRDTETWKAWSVE